MTKKFELIYKNFKEEIKLTKKESKELGKKQGEKIGRKEGKEERNIEIARAMLKEGDPLEKIVRITGLSESDIQKLS